MKNSLKSLTSIAFDIIWVVAAILIQLFAPLLFALILRNWDAPEHVIVHTSHIIGSVATGIFILIVGRKKASIRQNTILGDSDYGPITIGCFGAFAWMFFVSGAVAIVSCFTQNELLTAGNVASGYAELDMAGKAVSLFSMAIAAPFIEELIFRGMLLGALKSVYNVHFAVIVSALCFGLIHETSVPTVAFATGMGIILGYTLIVSGNLQNCIVVHMIYNAATSFRAFQMSDVETDIDMAVDSSAIITAAIVMILMAVFVLSLVGRWYYKKLK